MAEESSAGWPDQATSAGPNPFRSAGELMEYAGHDSGSVDDEAEANVAGAAAIGDPAGARSLGGDPAVGGREATDPGVVREIGGSEPAIAGHDTPARAPVAGEPLPSVSPSADGSATPVAAALRELDTLADRELSGHPDVYQRIHGELQSALAAIDDA